MFLSELPWVLRLGTRSGQRGGRRLKRPQAGWRPLRVEILEDRTLLDAVLAAHLFQGVVSMKESSTYQAILEEGERKGGVAELKKMLRLIGDKAFGPPDARTAAAIERLNELPRLEGILERVRTVSSWQELLGQPAPGRRDRRRRTS